MARLAEIAVIGVGELGADSLSPEARALVTGAAVLCGARRHLARFPEHLGERIVIDRDVDGLVARLRQETRRIAVLASGDPCLYGIGPLLAARLGRERVRILPNVSSVQLAFARLGLAWQDAAVLSAHGRPLDAILPAALTARMAAILTDDRNSPAAIARALLEAGDEDARADVFERLGGADERHAAGRLREIAQQAYASPNVLVVRREGALRPWPLGLPEEAFVHRGGMITKAEVRAVAVSKLRLREDDTVWDIGAGCGSVAIEAAALLRRGRVYAVERDADAIELLATNRRRFAAGNVVAVRGEAPAALAALPDPDAVFVGGSGGHLEAIARAATERLPPHGRLVANVAVLDHLTALRGLAAEGGWEATVTQVGVARERPLVLGGHGGSSEVEGDVAAGASSRLAALDPVFVVTLTRPRGGAGLASWVAQ